MTFSETVESLIEKLKSASYKYNSVGSGSHESNVLSSYNESELLAARQAISEWAQDNHNGLYLENEILKQKLKICNEIISKSNFAPMIAGGE